MTWKKNLMRRRNERKVLTCCLGESSGLESLSLSSVPRTALLCMCGLESP